jgi:Domain of unknown function (DUF4062)/inactive STAND
MARFYVSSSYQDLREERQAVFNALLRLHHMPVGMEAYNAFDSPPLDRCLADVRTCQAYIGIFAFRYGSVPRREGKCITQLEYEEAGRIGIPRFLFLVADRAPWPADRFDQDQTRIRALRQHLCEQHGVQFFATAAELAAAVLATVGEHFGRGEAVPDLLPHLCDRSEQEFELDRALRQLAARPARPLVCIVHGDELQCLDMFLRRLKEVSLPALLGLDPDGPAVTACPLAWPTQFRGTADLHDRLLLDLARKTVRAGGASREQVNQFWAEVPGPVLVHTHVLSEDWQRHGEQVVNGFLDLWHGWPDVAANGKLLVFLFVKYQLQQGRNFLVRRRFRAFNRQVAEALAAFDFARFDGLTGAVLPELGGITRGEAEDWARSSSAARFRGGEGLLHDIRTLFERWEAPTIPMERFESEIRTFLHRYNSPERA